MTRLKLTYRNGEWVTPDGMTTIGRVEGLTFCDNPHPERKRVPGKGIVTGYCSGGEEHHYFAGWDIRGDLHGLPDNEYDTLKRARAALAKAMGLEP